MTRASTDALLNVLHVGSPAGARSRRRRASCASAVGYARHIGAHQHGDVTARYGHQHGGFKAALVERMRAGRAPVRYLRGHVARAPPAALQIVTTFAPQEILMTSRRPHRREQPYHILILEGRWEP